jgi:AraC-like DNA-binding protein
MEPATEALESVVPLPATQAPFHERVEEFQLGSMRLWKLSPARAHVRRDGVSVRKQDLEYLQVMLLTERRPVIAGVGNATGSAQGEIVAWSSTSPYPIDVRAARSGTILVCPLAMLGPRAARLSRQTVLRFDSTAGPGLVLRECLLAIQAALEQDALTGCEQAMGEAALDLVRALYVQSASDSDRPAGALRRQVMEYVDEHLSEPALNAASIARALFVSRSHLCRAFQADGTTITRLIRHRRLERCRSDLVDPNLAHESIFVIASNWGFVSQAHFSRIFRAAYGCSPREMRQRAA